MCYWQCLWNTHWHVNVSKDILNTQTDMYMLLQKVNVPLVISISILLIFSKFTLKFFEFEWKVTQTHCVNATIYSIDSQDSMEDALI